MIQADILALFLCVFCFASLDSLFLFLKFSYLRKKLAHHFETKIKHKHGILDCNFVYENFIIYVGISFMISITTQLYNFKYMIWLKEYIKADISVEDHFDCQSNHKYLDGSLFIDTKKGKSIKKTLLE